MIWFRKLHKWIGLAIGAQVALWMISGLLMGLLDHDRVLGQHNQKNSEKEPLTLVAGRIVEVSAIVGQLTSEIHASRIRLTSFLGYPAYHLSAGDGPRLFDANTGERIVISAEIAAQIAQQDYSGEGAIRAVSAVQAPSQEVRRHAGAAWRVDFDDIDETSLYISSGDGAVLERRNSTWRLFDVFWMLHIMDYRGREDFNNTLVILASLIAAWFSVTGIALLFGSFRREDFLRLLPDAWWRKPARIAVCAPHGEVVARIDSFAAGRLYDELARENIVLPSNCGGGGTCGLCVVHLDPEWPETPSDRQMIPAHQRREGVRLSCQAEVADNMVVGISDEVLSAQLVEAKVVACRQLTPFIREIRLRVADCSFDYPAGSYVHVEIPPYQIAYSDLGLNDAARAAVVAACAPPICENDASLRRAYSLATASEEDPGSVVLNVRFMPPPEGSLGAMAGLGSTYMWSLEPGDRMNIIGPLGDFRAQETNRPMVFIGGGAGMAPLRSIIRSQLLHKRSTRRIDFWYGARSESDLFYDSEFDELQAVFENFSWHPALSEPVEADKWSGSTGFVHEAAKEDLLKRLGSLESCEFYICGPPPMLSATRQLLVDLCVPDSQIFFDDFGI